MASSAAEVTGALPAFQDPHLRAGLQVPRCVSLPARTEGRVHGGVWSSQGSRRGVLSRGTGVHTLCPAGSPLPQCCPSSSFSEQLEHPHELRSPSASRSVWGTSVHRGPLTSPAPMSTGLCHFLAEGLPSSQHRRQKLELGLGGPEGGQEGRLSSGGQGLRDSETLPAPAPITP